MLHVACECWQATDNLFFYKFGKKCQQFQTSWIYLESPWEMHSDRYKHARYWLIDSWNRSWKRIWKGKKTFAQYSLWSVRKYSGIPNKGTTLEPIKRGIKNNVRAKQNLLMLHLVCSAFFNVIPNFAAIFARTSSIRTICTLLASTANLGGGDPRNLRR